MSAFASKLTLGRSSVAHFDGIRSASHCPFARATRLWGSPDWASWDDLRANLPALLDDFCHFTSISRSMLLDGYVLELPEVGRTLAGLAKTTKDVLKILSDADPMHVHCMDDLTAIESVEWTFSFDAEKMFVLTFAPCYSPTNARSSLGIDSTFLIFQPLHSFERIIDPTDSRIPISMRHTIRDAFAREGQAYDGQISSSPFEAHRYVKPLLFGDPVVKWWLS